ncbi:MAG: 5-formyltetrahydrofolate cyclo-ligase [Eubacterium sp.]
MKSEKQFSITKGELRQKCLSLRKELKNKTELDEKIISNLLNSDLYKNAQTVLSYASLKNEIDTDCLISTALKDGKRVCVPLCESKEGIMSFYYINSLDELSVGMFGIREPNAQKCVRAEKFENALIVLPGLAFDLNGNRLGYGKGYYDRFLQIHPLNSVGLCYNSLIVDYIPTDEYDQRVSNIITDSRIIACGNGGKNG